MARATNRTAAKRGADRRFSRKVDMRVPPDDAARADQLRWWSQSGLFAILLENGRDRVPRAPCR
jgi:hypothetical protein